MTDMTIKTTYERIVAAYIDAGLKSTQSAIAESIGIEQGAVGAWKRGGNVVIGNMRLIAEKTGTCIEWLYTGKGPQSPASQEVSEVIDRLNALDEDTHQKALKILDALLGA